MPLKRMKWLVAVLGAVSLASGGATERATAGPGPRRSSAQPRWTKIADPPRDLLGRELPPGMDGAWCYVPPLKGFLLYGGYSPRFTNEGWLFDPAEGEMRLLWPDSSLGFDPAAGRWRALMPRWIRWSQDRPGPARGVAAVYVPRTGKMYLFGGHPAKDRDWWGKARLGTWELDPATMKFTWLGEVGPRGMVKAVYDESAGLIVAAPQRGSRRGEPAATWVFHPGSRRWERRTPAGPRPAPHPAFAYDPLAKKCIYFSEYGETWTYDAKENRWERAHPETSPPPRRHAAMAFSPLVGKVVLHGGLAKRKPADDPWRQAYAVFRAREGKWYSDTWTYDARENAWRRLASADGPPAGPSARDLCATDASTGALVLYDPARGFWAFGAPADYRRLSAPPRMVVSEEAKERSAADPAQPPGLDAAARAWQRKLRDLPDDSWLDPGIEKPNQGCISFDYNPKAGAVYWVAGCLGAAFASYEDYSYNNQVILFDMVVGRWFQRRANHVWMPDWSKRFRQGNGCGRAVCYDSRRGVVWTLGGVTGFTLPGAHRIQWYDFDSDRMGPELDRGPGWGSDCGLAYDAKNDLLVLVRGGYHPLETMVFDPAKGRWRPGAEHPPKMSQYTRVVYDPQVGVILVAPVPKGWKLGGRLPGGNREWRRMPLVMRVYAYDAAKDRWRDLEPAGAETVPAGLAPLGVAYDPVRRLVYVVKSNTPQGYGAPPRPMNVSILDLENNRWVRGKDSPPLPRMNMGSAVYDPDRNVVVVGAGGRLYLYRYRGGCPDGAFRAGPPWQGRPAGKGSAGLPGSPGPPGPADPAGLAGPPRKTSGPG